MCWSKFPVPFPSGTHVSILETVVPLPQVRFCIGDRSRERTRYFLTGTSKPIAKAQRQERDSTSNYFPSSTHSRRMTATDRNPEQNPPRRRYQRRGSVTEHTMRAQQTVMSELNLQPTPYTGARGVSNITASSPNSIVENGNPGSGELLANFPTNHGGQLLPNDDDYGCAPYRSNNFSAGGAGAPQISTLTGVVESGHSDDNNYLGGRRDSGQSATDHHLMMDPDQQHIGWNPYARFNAYAGRRDSTGSSAYSYNANTRRHSLENSGYDFSSSYPSYGGSTRRDSVNGNYNAD